MNRETLSRALSFLAQASEWLALSVLLAASIPPTLIHRRALTVVPSLNLLDGSWLLDTSYKAAGGVWFGRDVAFTYGPLFQWMSSAPSRWIGMSTGTAYATWYTLPSFVIILSTFWTARLLLPTAVPWRRALLVLLAVVYWSPLDVRVAVALLSFAILIRLCADVAASKSSIVPSALVAGAICVIAFLLSADTGLYSVAALLLCIAATSLAKGRISRPARFLLVATLGFAALVLVVNAAMLSPLNFKFWRSSLAITEGYRWFEPIRMAKADKHLLLEIFGLGLGVFIAGTLNRRRGQGWTRQPTFLLAGFFLAVLMMQSGLVRSDHPHVLIGIYPLIFLSGAIALDEFDSGRFAAAGLPLAVVTITVVLAHPYPMFWPGSVFERTKQWIHPVLTCPAGTQPFDGVCLSPSDAHLLTSISSFVSSHGGPSDPIAVFPYESAFGLTSRRQVAGGVLQSYLVNGNYLTALEIEGLRKAKPGVGLYLPDGILSERLDGVPNFTRNPALWFYYLSHYRAESSPAPGVLGLVRDDSREEKLGFRSQTIVKALGVVRITKRATYLDLGAVAWPAIAPDFLKFRLRVDYPFWWRVRKPSCITLQISFADGSHKSIQLVIHPNRATDIWIYPWDDRDMGRYFSGVELDRQPQNWPAVSRLQLFVTPFDWISVVPNRLAVEAVEAVQLSFS